MVLIERGGSPRPIDAYITEASNGLNWVKIGDAPEQGRYITKTAEKIRPEGLSKTREVNPGDLILSNSMSFGKPYIMGINGCIHDGWLLIRDINNNFDLKFLCHMLGTDQMLNQYRSLAAGSTVNNLNKELVGNTKVTVPSVPEQRILGQYLENIDHLITLHQRKYDALVTIKKSMLEKMFPTNNSTIPSIRFNGFTDAWEQRKLEDYFKKYQNTVYLQDEEKYRQISIRNTGVVEYRCTNKGKNIGRKRQYLIDTDTHPITLTFTRQTVYEGGIGFVPKELNGAIVTENMPLFEMINADQEFMKSLFKTSGYYKSVIDDNTLIGSAQKALHEKQWLDSRVCIPALGEQTQIGLLFSTIDKIITLHQRKLEILKNIKKSFLNKMFL